ncbi:protein yippee-like 2 isoform X1 [Ursus americanus]|uniref:protein yippee-like 2 isoform X1 n=1 Tax=Ursus americanus TaxID=9643 RepID=UPI001E679B61|nr:protein yippee-like 2 isoform X1 [Ursus americanus]
MRSGGGGSGGDCGFKSAPGAREPAGRSFAAAHPGGAEPCAGRTGQPAAGHFNTIWKYIVSLMAGLEAWERLSCRLLTVPADRTWHGQSLPPLRDEAKEHSASEVTTLPLTFLVGSAALCSSVS